MIDRASTGVVMFGWETHDRHPTTTKLAIIGIPIAVIVAIVGLPPVDIHGPLHYLGIMGPTCGMTRGVMWTARGDLIRAWQFNPASLLIIPTMVALAARTTYGKITGRWLNLHIRWRPWLWLIPAVVILVLTIRQQLNIAFLLANPAG
ncbi:MAG: DUF2752 domain-containing protein [Acidimicrobiales bacterium]|nr:DUF2752 domain-containing protein [Acidimicrobiales bacterium]